jgi:hypothetical protein
MSDQGVVNQCGLHGKQMGAEGHSRVIRHMVVVTKQWIETRKVEA